MEWCVCPIACLKSEEVLVMADSWPYGLWTHVLTSEIGKLVWTRVELTPADVSGRGLGTGGTGDGVCGESFLGGEGRRGGFAGTSAK